MAKSKLRKSVAARRAEKKRRKALGLKPSGESKYARKRAYLNKHGLWGFEVAEPKPWAGARRSAA